MLPVAGLVAMPTGDSNSPTPAPFGRRSDFAFSKWPMGELVVENACTRLFEGSDTYRVPLETARPAPSESDPPSCSSPDPEDPKDRAAVLVGASVRGNSTTLPEELRLKTKRLPSPSTVMAPGSIKPSFSD